MGTYYGNIFKVDWTNLEAVIVVAKALASANNPQLVIHRPEHGTYGICFADKRTNGKRVLWRSDVGYIDYIHNEK